MLLILICDVMKVKKAVSEVATQGCPWNHNQPALSHDNEFMLWPCRAMRCMGVCHVGICELRSLCRAAEPAAPMSWTRNTNSGWT